MPTFHLICTHLGLLCHQVVELQPVMCHRAAREDDSNHSTLEGILGVSGKRASINTDPCCSREGDCGEMILTSTLCVLV